MASTRNKKKTQYPAPPEYFDNTMKDEWNKHIEFVTYMRRSLKLLESYCFYYCQWKETIEKLQEIGPLVKGKNNTPIENPLVSVSGKLNDKWSSAAGKLGIGKDYQ